MTVIHLSRLPSGSFKVSSPSRDTIAFPISDPVYDGNLWHRDLVVHVNGHFDGGSQVKMMHYHPGRNGSFGRFGLAFIDLLARAGLLVSARRVNPRLAAGALATKSGLYVFRDANEALSHFTDSSNYPHEGYYADTECVIAGKIMRHDVVSQQGRAY